MAKNSNTPNNSSTNRSLKLPILIELVFTLSKLIVVLVGVIVMVTTFANGNPYWVAMLRGGVSVLVLGLLVWMITWSISKGVIHSARSMLKEVDDNELANKGNVMDTNV